MQDSRYHSPGISRTRKMIIIIAAVIAASLLVMPALAHAPSDVAVSYNKDANKLSVTITHSVDDPATHYIRNIKINDNGRIVVDKDYTSQPSKDSFTYTYEVPVEAGDSIRVTAYCINGGSTEGLLTLPTPTATAPPTIAPTTLPVPPTTQKSPAGIIPLLGLLVCGTLFVALNRR